VLTISGMATALPLLLTAQEVADALRVSTSTVYRWAADGTLTAVTVGAAVRFRREDIEQLLTGEAAS
jgi:excisionase family DNA binding protein